MNKTKILATIMAASMVLAGCSSANDNNGDDNSKVESTEATTPKSNEVKEIDLFEGVFLEFSDAPTARHPEFSNSGIIINSENSPYKDYVRYLVQSVTNNINSFDVKVYADYSDMEEYIVDNNCSVKDMIHIGDDTEEYILDNNSFKKMVDNKYAKHIYTVSSADVNHYLISEAQYTESVAQDVDIYLKSFFENDYVEKVMAINGKDLSFSVVKKFLLLPQEGSETLESPAYSNYGIVAVFKNDKTNAYKYMLFYVVLGADGSALELNNDTFALLYYTAENDTLQKTLTSEAEAIEHLNDTLAEKNAKLTTPCYLKEVTY